MCQLTPLNIHQLKSPKMDQTNPKDKGDDEDNCEGKGGDADRLSSWAT